MSKVLSLIDEVFCDHILAKEYLISHSRAVAKLAEIAAMQNLHLGVDATFVRNAAMLHDIGIVFCHAPSIGCFGSDPYIRHGILGAELLKQKGYSRYARICECHIGIGITKEEIILKEIPLPVQDYLPLSHEERIVCIADKFFSKSSEFLNEPKPFNVILDDMSRLGERQKLQFEEFYHFYGFERALQTYYN